MRLLRFLPILLALDATAASGAETPPPADRVLLNARVYTADPGHRIAQALVVTGDRLVYVGDRAHAQAYIGKRTRVTDLHDRLVLPGLIDSHLHPIDSAKPQACDLDSRTLSLAELSQFVRHCIEHYHTRPGEWVSVRQWNYANGNATDAAHPTLRAALDAASTEHPIHLLGNDGHHGAFNSRALAGARNAAGQVVGLDRRTLATDFQGWRAMAGVDASGEPDGAVNETLQYAIDGPEDYASEREDYAAVMRAPWRVIEQLNAAGITGMLDASLVESRVPFYDALVESGRLSLRAAIAQFYDPERFRDAGGTIDYTAMIARARAVREHFAGQPLVRADVVKLYADGGLDGNPAAMPPTLPNGAVLRPYLQPRFRQEPGGRMQLAGYVDVDSAACAEARGHPAELATGTARADFVSRAGHLPEQCSLSTGQLYEPPSTIFEFVRRFHEQGFALHIHVIGDRAARTAIDALEAARAGGGPDLGRDGLAHLELAAPQDVQRIGADHLYVAFTYAWAYAEPEYDLSIVPFIDRVAGSDVAALHPQDGYYERNAYPVRGVRDAGGILVGGSDAPVETRDPRPFVNIARAVTRSLPGGTPLNPGQAISLEDAIDSYTINGARFIGWGDEAGSLEAGKSADFIVLDRDILQLAQAGRYAAIEATRVQQTWFRGRRVGPRGGASRHAPGPRGA